jgi:hypothetical protein
MRRSETTKRFAALLATGALGVGAAIGVAACGSDDNSDTNSTPPSASGVPSTTTGTTTSESTGGTTTQDSGGTSSDSSGGSSSDSSGGSSSGGGGYGY